MKAIHVSILFILSQQAQASVTILIEAENVNFANCGFSVEVGKCYKLENPSKLFEGGCPVTPAQELETLCLGDGPFDVNTAWIQDFESNYIQTDTTSQKWDFTSVAATVALAPPGLGALASIGGRVNMEIKNDRQYTTTTMTTKQRYVQKASNIKVDPTIDHYLQALPPQIYYLDGYTLGYWSELKFHFTFDKIEKMKSFQAFFWIKFLFFKMDFTIFDMFNEANSLKATCTVFLKQLKSDGTVMDFTADIDISDPSQSEQIVEKWVSRVQEKNDNYKPMEYIFKSSPNVNNANSGKNIREMIVMRAEIVMLIDAGGICVVNDVTIVGSLEEAQAKLIAIDELLDRAMSGETIYTRELNTILNAVQRDRKSVV